MGVRAGVASRVPRRLTIWRRCLLVAGVAVLILGAARPDLICILGDLVIQGVLGGRFVTPEAIGLEWND